MQIQEVQELGTEELVELYSSVGWDAYTDDPEGLTRAVCSSTYIVTARKDSALIGLARVISDEVSIAYLQDVLVDSGFQGSGVGRALMEACMERFAHVRAFVLMTDDSSRQLRFYEKMGLSNTRTLTRVQLNTFVRFKGVELS